MSSYRHKSLSGYARIGATALTAIIISGCSSDAQRLTDYPLINRTASVSKAPDASVGRVASRPLDNAAIPSAKPSWQTGYSAQPRPATQGTRTSFNQPARSGTITVKRGQTLYSIAKANGTNVATLAAANAISAPYTLTAGQRVVVPGTSSPISPAPSFRPQTAQPAYAPVHKANYSATGIHRVRRGETLFALGRTYGLNPYEIARYNNLVQPYALSVGQVVKIPGNGNGTARLRQPATANQFKQPAFQTPGIAASQTPEVPPIGSAPVRTPEPKLIASGFRWPVRGRVISSYGPKDNGTRNEGINIAVPEGTSVRAAEAGVVAYAGNELKGYGNLILVRHKNGWVTAYAHNRDLFVRRGDTVKRGEEIAKAGSTGSVTTPQLHFELRKGASAVDPVRYLGNATALN